MLQLVKKPDFPVDERGRIPNPQIISRWRNNEMWDLWADDLDARAMTVVEDSLIAQKAEMLKRHADMAHQLQLQGMDYLKEEGFDSSSSAVTAIIKGAELERTARGIGEMIVKMAQMDDTQLADEIVKLLNRAGENNQIIDADEVPEEKKEDTTEE